MVWAAIVPTLMVYLPLLHHLNHITCLLSRENPFAMHFFPAYNLGQQLSHFFSRKTPLLHTAVEFDLKVHFIQAQIYYNIIWKFVKFSVLTANCLSNTDGEIERTFLNYLNLSYSSVHCILSTLKVLILNGTFLIQKGVSVRLECLLNCFPK